MKKSEWIKILKKIKTTCLEKIRSEQFHSDTVLLPLLAGLALVVILAAAIAGIQNISSGLGDGQMESRAATPGNSSVQEPETEREEAEESDAVPESRSGFYSEDGTLYYYNEDGSLYQGWLFENENWYYFTEEGAVTGYQVIQEYGRADECYFEADGRLVMDAETPDGRIADSDGYLTEAGDAENWADFEIEAAETGIPGSLSGVRVAEEPAEFYMLSIAGESSGGKIITGDRGRAYGLCQLDYRYDLEDFMHWAYGRHPHLWQELAGYLEIPSGDTSLIANMGIQQAFEAARGRDYEAAVSDELEFMRLTYWDVFASKMNAAGYRLSERNIAVSAAFFSVNVNCGNQTAVFLEQLSPEMTDTELICEIYKIRNTILAEQKVGRGRKGTTARYRMAEPHMALDLLHGFTTIDSVKDYGGGVQWNGDLFVNAVLTSAVQGISTEWEEALLATPSEAETETAEPDGQEQAETVENEYESTANVTDASEEY